MPCGKKPLVKNWDRPRYIRTITPSRYEQNEASVKVHWKRVIRDLELSYKDDQFWKTQCSTVRKLVGPMLFHRLAKIFDLPLEATAYEPQPDDISLEPSEVYYKTRPSGQGETREEYSMSDFEESVEEEIVEEESEEWSVSSAVESDELKRISRKSVTMSKTRSLSKVSKIGSKSFSKFALSKSKSLFDFSDEESAHSSDDMVVHYDGEGKTKKVRIAVPKVNPHFHMLYCNESETDMIKWKSKYKTKKFEVSASDEFSKKAEILAKQIASEFFDWWVALGNVEFKSEIRRPEDIEDLFQIWFDEHASRSLVLYPKIMPCVLPSIANYVGVPRESCPNSLKRQIACDVKSETSPAVTMAFGTCLPQKMKQVPPNNNTAEQWQGVEIPKDLKTMSCVWEDVQHLTSTKAFQKWLAQRPHLPMPTCLKQLDTPGDKKQLFVVPSDFVGGDRGSQTSGQDLALPVSQFSLELKEVLSKLMNQD